MHWQFGGNFQPVRMICEIDWRECPMAIVNYIWSEIVTDVVDCLTNEWMMWRVIAMLFVCTLLIHTIYTKSRWMDETTINRENLNVVGCKVQDLELKVNILTYKMQYGTWPLPRQIHATGIERGLRNIKLTLTNSSERNDWLKHMLLSPSENSSCVPYAKIGPRSVRCLTKLINLETKYMATRFSRDPSPASNQAKSSRSTSEKSVKYERTSKKSLGIDGTKELPKSENLGIRKKECIDSSLNFMNNCWSETQVLKYREYQKAHARHCHDIGTKKIASKKTGQFNKSSEERVNSTQETLHQVKEKLENLHSVLRICGNSATAENEESCSKKELAESILQDLKMIGNLPTESESDGKTVELIKQPQLLDSNTEDSQCTREEEEDEQMDSTSEYEKCRSDNDLSTNRSCQNIPIIPRENNNLSNTENILNNDSSTTEIHVRKRSRTSSAQDDKEDSTGISQDVVNLPATMKLSVSKSVNEDLEKSASLEKIEKELTSSSQAELSKESDVDEKSNVTLLREALKFKKALINQIECESVEKTMDDPQIHKSDGSESDDSIWPKVKSYFQPKVLDIISEEQSASSSNEKATKNCGLIDNLGDKEKFIVDKSALENHMVEAAIEHPESSALALVSGSSEYFSSNNLEETIVVQVSNDPRERDLESIDDCTENDSFMKQEKDHSQKNISDLLDQSVRNIREYIDVFSQMQNDAIVETRRAINDENDNDEAFIRVTKSSSVDSITHFVNKVAITISEELPHKLSESAIISLDDLENLKSDEDSPGSSDDRPEFSLKRRPGSISLAEKKSSTSENELSNENLDAPSFFESVHSETDDDDRRPIADTETLSSEPSCKELVMDYSLESDNDFLDEKLGGAMNLMEFEEEPEAREKGNLEEKSRILDSPLTGRTVIRAIESLASNFEVVSMSGSNDPVDIVEYTEIKDCPDEISTRERSFDRELEAFMDLETMAEISEENVIPVTSSVYLTDDASFLEIEQSCRTKNDNELGNVDSAARILQNSHQAIGMLENTIDAKKEVELRTEMVEDNHSAISDTLVQSNVLAEDERKELIGNFSKRPESGGTVIITDSSNVKLKKDQVPSNVHLTSDISGTYMDASSRGILNSNDMSLTLDKAILNAMTNFQRDTSNKSARGSCSLPLKQRISRNSPKKGTSLNNASAAKTRIVEKSESKRSSKNLRTTNQQPKSIRSQSSEIKQPRARSNYSLRGTRDLESSNTIMGRPMCKSNVDVPERRSRSYVTPRNSEPSPRMSTISQSVETQRPSRARKEPVISETSVESGNSTCSPNGGGLLRSCVSKTSSKSCIPILRSRLEAVRQSSQEKRAKSPMRCPLTISTSSWSQENRLASESAMIGNIQVEGSHDIEQMVNKESAILDSVDTFETLETMDCTNEESTAKLPEGRTVIYVNIVTEQERKSATRVVDPKKFLEYLKDRKLKVQSVLDQEIGVEGSAERFVSAEPGIHSSPRILTIVSSAVDGESPSDQSLLPPPSNNSPTTGHSWSLRVEHREIEVSAKPSVIDTSTSISDLPDAETETRGPDNNEKFQIFQVPKELTKEEYIVLLEALNQDPNLHQLREMHKLCSKLGLGFHE